MISSPNIQNKMKLNFNEKKQTIITIYVRHPVFGMHIYMFRHFSVKDFRAHYLDFYVIFIYFTQMKWFKIKQKITRAQKLLLRFDFLLKFHFVTTITTILSVGDLDA